MVVSKEAAKLSIPEVWKTSGASSPDMSSSLKAALRPHGKISIGKQGTRKGDSYAVPS